MYSQNNEEAILLNYFRGYTGTILDLGANDGKILSNSYQLIKNGWTGVLVDASFESIEEAKENHKYSSRVFFHNVGIGKEDGEFELHHSDTHLNKGDRSLLSTFCKEDFDKWKGCTKFTSRMVKCVTWQTFYRACEVKKLDAITIDIEGLDYFILTQIDLGQTETKLVCVEWNGREMKKYVDYCSRFGLSKLLLRNGENLILAK